MTFRPLRLHPAPLLLCAALSLPACDALREHPEQSPADNPQPPQLRVKLALEGPPSCAKGWVSLSATVKGGYADRVTFLEDGVDFTPGLSLANPQVFFECESRDEGPHTFVARAWSGEQSFDSAPLTLVVDRTRPAVLGWRPDTAFPTVETPVELVFNEPMNPDSLRPSATVLRDGAGLSVAHQAVFSEDGRSLRLVPSQPLHAPVTLHAELVQSDLTDLAGNSLGGTSSSGDFGYGPFARLAPSPTRKDVSRFTFALNPREKDHPFIALLELDGVLSRDGQFFVARWSGSAWERLPDIRTPQEVAQDVTHPAEIRLAVPGDGLPVLAWCTEGATARITVKRFDGAAWQPMGVPDATGSDCASFRMALDGGNPVLVHEVRNTDLRVTRWDGTAWRQLGGDVNANPAQGLARNADLAVSGGVVFLAWTELPPGASGGERVFVGKYENGGWFQVGQPFPESGIGRAGQLALAVDAGAPMVAWAHQYDPQDHGALLFRRWNPAGNEWSLSELIEGPTAFSSLGAPVLALGASGPWVAWAQANAQGGSDIHYRRRSYNWESKQLVAEGLFAGFQLDADGAPWVAVSTNRTSTDQAVLLRPQ